MILKKRRPLNRRVVMSRAAATMKRLRLQALSSNVRAASDSIEGHTFECRFSTNEVWMVDGRRQPKFDALAFLNELYKPVEQQYAF